MKATVTVVYKPSLGEKPFVVKKVKGTTDFLPGQCLDKDSVDKINADRKFNQVEISG